MSIPLQRTAVLTGHNGPVNCLTFSAGQGQYVLTGSSDRTIRLFNPTKAPPSAVPARSSLTKSTTPPLGLVQTYSAHGYEVLDVAVSADNARFASVGGDRQVFLWDVATSRTLRRWAGHAARVHAVAFGGTGDSVVASGGFDATVRLWDARSQSVKPIQVLEEARDSVSGIDVHGHELAAASVDGKARVYDLRMGMLHVDVLGPAVTSVCQTRDGNGLLVSTLDGTIRLLDKGNGQLLQTYQGHTNAEYRIRSTLAFGDSVVLSGSEDGALLAWDVLEGTVLTRIEKPHGGKVPSAVAVNHGTSAGKREWSSAGADGNVIVWGSESPSQ